MNLTPKRIAEFWAKVTKTPGCWYWEGCTSGTNRGSFSVEGRRYVPTEIVLALHGQVRKNGLMILHKCDNKACVNPDHLYWGTQFNNMADRSERHPGWVWQNRRTMNKKERLRAAV